MSTPITVIVVDDSAFMRKSLSMMLESDPQIKVVATARNGKEGIERIRALKPDLVTMDIEMPEMDGLEMCRRVKADERWRDIHIIMITGNSDEESLDEAFATGVMDYITKPIRAPILLARVRTQLELKQARDLMRDAAFGWHTWIWARLQSRTGKSKVFYYYFDQHPDYPADSPQAGRGSPHGQEVAYVFQHLNPNQKSDKSDEAISEAMATYWTNFAKFGDPNGAGLPKWPAFSDSTSVLMYFAQTPHTGPVPSADALKVMDQYFAWRRTPEGEAFVK